MDRNDRTDGHDRHGRHDRDATGIGPYAHERDSLVGLSTLPSWTVSDGDPDIRGWDVRTIAGRQLGSVNDLLIDAKAGEAVLLDVDLAGTERHTFVPLRVVEIDRTRQIVLMDSADLPDATLGPSERAAARATDAAASGSVRLPRGDREVAVDRTPLADEPPPPDNRSMGGGEAPTGRQRAERRRIDRMSTDL